jgi:hypothetical protein
MNAYGPFVDFDTAFQAIHERPKPEANPEFSQHMIACPYRHTILKLVPYAESKFDTTLRKFRAERQRQKELGQDGR